jgi:hypothetical protein
MYKEELLPQNPRNIDKWAREGFAKWLKSRVSF